MNNEGKPPNKSNSTLMVVVAAVVLIPLVLLCGFGAVGAMLWGTVRSEPVVFDVEPNAQIESVSGTSSRFDTRLAAAEQIQDDAKRRAALAAIARDEAQLGKSKPILQILSLLGDQDAENDLAAELAPLVAQKLNVEGATRIANRITDEQVRDDTLVKIANE